VLPPVLCVRCLHTYYAAHLVRPNTIGAMLDEYWLQEEVAFPHKASLMADKN
jgi:hypothetical protein